MLRRVLFSTLDRAGYRTFTAAGLAEVRRVLGGLEGPLDLVVTDFLLEADADVQNWREITAQLMRVFVPCDRFRFKDSCLSFPPELKAKQQGFLDEGRAECQQVVPFTLRMEKTGDYPSRVRITWFSDQPEGRVELSVTIYARNTGARRAGFVFDPDYQIRWNGGRQARVLVGYSRQWPFRTQQVAQFYSYGKAKPGLAWWTADVVADGVEMADAFLNLTTPKAG